MASRQLFITTRSMADSHRKFKAEKHFKYVVFKKDMLLEHESRSLLKSSRN